MDGSGGSLVFPLGGGSPYWTNNQTGQTSLPYPSGLIAPPWTNAVWLQQDWWLHMDICVGQPVAGGYTSYSFALKNRLEVVNPWSQGQVRHEGYNSFPSGSCQSPRPPSVVPARIPHQAPPP
jgi:hypothetical protein